MAKDFTIVVVRHAEKAVAESDPALNSKGKQRAQLLAEMLSKLDLKAVYSTPFQRTEQTAQPAAKRFDLAVQNYKAGDGEVLVEKLLAAEQTALVVGHSNTVPGIVGALGVEVESMTEKEYGDVFLLHFRDGQPRLHRLMIPMIEEKE
ncbi:histidine phosphatase family protein [Pseudidiomarina sp. 1APP75-32.1]|uniref:Histidine phosphatase family protein n=1 Tax=Pseudidiomarina terrestris TaxID=2820060 RepID=A0AAW7QUX0_9GAMM|nr:MULTISPECIES: histidine phosphatase family protein [unclassified Pseudidiomarina]MDN7124016.1 histidine phosphatase family protein [Pseudidiomarina sp. 1APP75-32.1]MDN7127080.1 histidine phosphatase family protein [Pseudidiomarina sp. 1APR75-33.1]